MKKLGGKKILVGALSAALAAGSAMTAFAAPGWNQNTTGWWWENADGSYVVNNWVQDAGKWYFMDGNGYMSCGWIWDNGNWYFADASGAMLTGWVRVDGAVYYLNPVSDGTQGAMATGVRTIDGVSYTFDASGACMNSGSYNRTEIPSYNGNGTVAAVPVEAHASRPSGGGSSSGGSSSDTTQTVAESKNEVAQAMDEAVKSIESDEVKVSGAEGNYTLTVAADSTAKVADEADAMIAEVENMLEDENIVGIAYSNTAGGGFEALRTVTEETEAGVIAFDTVAGQLEALVGEKTFNDLKGKTYEVSVTYVGGITDTYKVTVK